MDDAIHETFSFLCNDFDTSVTRNCFLLIKSHLKKKLTSRNIQAKLCTKVGNQIQNNIKKKKKTISTMKASTNPNIT